MKKIKIFKDDDDDEDNHKDSSLIINKDYASNYNKWRRKEELQKLKDRYGNINVKWADKSDDDSSSTSETEDDSAEEVTPCLEKEFFTALSALKGRDPKIYDSSSKFYSEVDLSGINPKKVNKKTKDKPLYLKDYESSVVVNREGRYSDSEEQSNSNILLHDFPKSYIQQQKELKDSLKEALRESDDDDEFEGFIRKKSKSTEETVNENNAYLSWLKGNNIGLSGDSIVGDLKSLHETWNDPQLDDNEKFLRDYLLNHTYRDVDKDDIPSYEEIVAIDEQEADVERSDQFEAKYNFRFEEPDLDFIKSYPRTLSDSMRTRDTRRKEKRSEYRKRKEIEKSRKVEEIKQLKNFKKQELIEKLEKLKSDSGTSKIPFKIEDLDADFNPEEYDQKMRLLYSDDFYNAATVNDEVKPEWSESDDAEEPDWENWTDHLDEGNKNKSKIETDEVVDEHEPHCSSVAQNKQHSKHILAQALIRKKPKFEFSKWRDFEQYFDEYYKLDCEDIIGGNLPTRFKYRKVPENDFGLAFDEILMAEDRELNSWVSLRKMSQYRNDNEEKFDKNAFSHKSTNMAKKQKVLKSLFPHDQQQQQLNNFLDKKLNKNKNHINVGKNQQRIVSVNSNLKKFSDARSKKTKCNMHDQPINDSRIGNRSILNMSDERLKAYGMNPRKLKDKIKYGGKKSKEKP